MAWKGDMLHPFNLRQVEAMAAMVAATEFKSATKAEVKSNEALNSVKPRPIQHFGDEGTAWDGPTSTALFATCYLTEIFMERGEKQARMIS